MAVAGRFPAVAVPVFAAAEPGAGAPAGAGAAAGLAGVACGAAEEGVCCASKASADASPKARIAVNAMDSLVMQILSHCFGFSANRQDYFEPRCVACVAASLHRTI